MKRLLILIAVFSLPGIVHAQDEASRLAAGCGPNEIQYGVTKDSKQHPKGIVDAEKALVYMLDGRFAGSVTIGAPPSRVGVDGTWIGANKLPSYFFFYVTPGQHNLCTSAKGITEKVTIQSLAATSFTAEAGQTYYFVVKEAERPDAKMQWKIRKVSEAEGQLLIGSLAHSTSKQKTSK